MMLIFIPRILNKWEKINYGASSVMRVYSLLLCLSWTVSLCVANTWSENCLFYISLNVLGVTSEICFPLCSPVSPSSCVGIIEPLLCTQCHARSGLHQSFLSCYTKVRSCCVTDWSSAPNSVIPVLKWSLSWTPVCVDVRTDGWEDGVRVCLWEGGVVHLILCSKKNPEMLSSNVSRF